MSETFASMKGWENFYVIAGSSASGLTGLTFVVIALASDANMVRLSGLRAFITPTVIHFGSVLWIASILSIPGHTPLSLAISIALTGLVLTIYSILTIYRMASIKQYSPALQDWIWNAAAPLLCCLTLLLAAALLLQHSVAALYLIGLVTLATLFIGIHNAWDLAVWITAERPSKRQEHEAQDAQDAQDGKPPL